MSNYNKYCNDVINACCYSTEKFLEELHLDYINSEIIRDDDILQFERLRTEMRSRLIKSKKESLKKYRSKRFISDKDLDKIKLTYKILMTEISDEYKNLFAEITLIEL